MLTDCLFREDSYLKECSATVLGLTDAGGIETSPLRSGNTAKRCSIMPY